MGAQGGVAFLDLERFAAGEIKQLSVIHGRPDPEGQGLDNDCKGLVDDGCSK